METKDHSLIIRLTKKDIRFEKLYCVIVTEMLLWISDENNR